MAMFICVKRYLISFSRIHVSITMSAATKRKHVVKEVLDDFVLPEEDQQIVKVNLK